MEAPAPIQVLIGKAKNGDRDAFNDLVAFHREELDKYVRLRLGSHLRQKIDLEDVLQESFVRAFQSIENFRWQGETSFLKWLKSIAEHAILETARRNRQGRVYYLDRNSHDEETSPSRGLRREERFDRFQDALDALSPEHRQVILLSRIQGLRTKEIAKRMNRSPKAVECLLSRARKSLKDAFGDTESLHLPPRRLNEQESEDVQ